MRARACAMNCATALCSACRCLSSFRSLSQRQYGNGVIRRLKSAGRILSRCCWMTSVVRLERVDVGAEGEPGGDVDRVAHQVGLQVDRFARRRRALPAAREAAA